MKVRKKMPKSPEIPEYKWERGGLYMHLWNVIFKKDII
jgi:hypothetical protein